MGTLEIVMGIILLVFALFLIISVLLQSAKDKRLSGAIAGGAESFLGKDRGSRLDKLLNIITPIVAGIFAVLVIVMYCIVA
jgi:preprotein translocase subunit SecG